MKQVILKLTNKSLRRVKLANLLLLLIKSPQRNNKTKQVLYRATNLSQTHLLLYLSTVSLPIQLLRMILWLHIHQHQNLDVSLWHSFRKILLKHQLENSTHNLQILHFHLLGYSKLLSLKEILHIRILSSYKRIINKRSHLCVKFLLNYKITNDWYTCGSTTTRVGSHLA